MMKPRESEEAKAWIDCRARTGSEVLAAVAPLCLVARAKGMRPVIFVRNLAHLADSAWGLLQSLDRMASKFQARIVLAEPPTIAGRVLDARSANGRFEPGAVLKYPQRRRFVRANRRPA